MPPEALTFLGQFGAEGAFVWYLIWREKRDAEARLKFETDRLSADKDRIEADKTMATALTALKMTIEGLAK
jgi:hypothetical protein